MDLPFQERRDSSSKTTSPASSVTSCAAPLICLDVRDSSTESDKTVLSVNTVMDQATGCGAGGVGRGSDSIPSTPGGIVSQASLPLPEIVVEEPRTPPATSPATSPVSANAQIGGEGNGDGEEKALCGNGGEGKIGMRRRPSSPKVFVPKASSLPPLSGNCASWLSAIMCYAYLRHVSLKKIFSCF